MSVHDAAALGFATGAGAYATGRPDYPPALDRWLVDALGLGPGKIVADLGAGTGKFVPRLLSTGASVVAIEPVDAMRARLSADFPHVDVRSGTADAMPLPDASVHAVVCAQAFHWFADRAALAEIGRVLVPGGALALVWNVRDESVPWVRRLTGIVAPYEGDTPRFASGAWRTAFPAIDFGPLAERWVEHVQIGPPERTIVDRFLSVSFIAALPPDERARVEARLRALIADEFELAGREAIAFPYRTIACHCIRHR